MRYGLYRGAATVLVAMLVSAGPVLLVLILLGLGSTAAQAATAPSVMGQPDRPNVLARVDLSSVSPRMVTATSGPVLRVTGSVVNIGDQPITKLAVRLQRDEPVNSDDAAARALAGDAEAPHVTRFQPLPVDLAPGQSSPFTLAVPLRGGTDLESLQITEPGVYPVLVNLNGKPDAGGVARLASVPLLLPVLGIPSASPGGPPGPVLAAPSQPAPLT
ncbi:MAG: DUF6049 family protein, partial [Pseudonocardiaceae bacterium]